MRRTSFIYPGLVLIWILVPAIVLCLRPAHGLPGKHPSRKDWKVIAEADLIAIGKLSAPLNAIKSLQSAKKCDYVNVRLDPDVVVKGTGGTASITVRYYVGPPDSAPYSPNLKILTKLNGKKVITLLLHSDESDCVGYYFVDDSSRSLRSFDTHDFLSVKQEVAKQKEVIQHFQELPPCKKDASDSRVRELLEQITAEKTQDQAWDKLMALKKDSVPALIRAMDDARALAHPAVELRNPPNFFESVSHYGPVTILDAVSILLNQKTMDGVTTSNGGSDTERRACVRFWKIWAFYNY